MAEALIKFSQDTLSDGGNGIAFIGVLGQLATVSNSDNTGVHSWQIDLVYSDPSSSITAAEPYSYSNNGSAPEATFTPDVTRSFRFVLKVWSAINRPGEPDDVDIRVFTVKEPSGVVVPPSQIWPRPLPPEQSEEPGSKPNEMNFEGQPDGWAGTGGGDGLLNDTLTKVLFSSPEVRFVEKATLVPSNKQNGSLGLPYSSIQPALDDIYDSSINTSWVIYVAAGHYDDEDLHIPPERKIVIIGPDYGMVHINTTSHLPISWEVRGTTYLSFKNIRAYSITGSASGHNPPDVATLSLENTSFQLINTVAVSCDVVTVGPSTFLENVSLTGRLATDGIDHLTEVSCGTLAIYDTLVTGGASLTVNGDGIATDCQIDAGASFVFTGYAAKFYVDAMTKYWLDFHSISVTGATIVLMGESASTNSSPTFYVNVNSAVLGEDGTVGKPFTTITAGLGAAAALQHSGYGEITLIVTPGQYTDEGTLHWTLPYPRLNIYSSTDGPLYTADTVNSGGRGDVFVNALTITGSGYVRTRGISCFLSPTTVNSGCFLESYRSDFNFGYPSNLTGTGGMVRLTECTVFSNTTNFLAGLWAIKTEFPDGLHLSCSGTRVALTECVISGGSSSVLFSVSAGKLYMDDFTYRYWDPSLSVLTNGTFSIYGYFGMERNVGPIETNTTSANQTIGFANMSDFGTADCQISGQVWMSSRQMDGSEFGGLIEKKFVLRRVAGTLALSVAGSDIVTAASSQPAGTLTLSVSGASLLVACTPSATSTTEWLGKVRVENVQNV